MARNKDKWSALSMSERADLIKLYVSNGITSLNDIKKDYNSFAIGGDTDDGGKLTKFNGNVRILEGTEEEQTITGENPLTGIFGKVLQKYYDNNLKPFIDKHGVDSLRTRLYEGLYPGSYDDVKNRVKKVLEGENERNGNRSMYRDDIWAEYLQIPKDKRKYVQGVTKVSNSLYKPTIANDTNRTYKKIDLSPREKRFLIESSPDSIGESELHRGAFDYLSNYFGQYTQSRGFDNKGEYVSYYDEWDLSPVPGGNADQSMGIGNPIYFYDRLYLDDYYNIPEEFRGNPYITPAVITAEKKNNGGKLNKFTTGGPVRTFDMSTFAFPTQYWEDYIKNNTFFSIMPKPIDEKELVRRQAWAESAGNDRAGSHKGAKGRYQIMPNTLKEYQKATKDIGNIYDPVYNRRVRDWEFNRYKNSDQVNRGEPTDSVKMGRRLAIYNYGYGNTRKALNAAAKAGINIDTSFDWLQYLPKETQDYVNFILRNKDTGAHRTNEAYKNRKK